MACPHCGESLQIGKSLVRGSEDTVEKASTPDQCPNCDEDLPDNNGGGHRLEKGI